MYERFTDRLRKVMQLANQEAQRFNHEYIGTEHLLLGLVKENGVASVVLKNLDVDPRKIRLDVEKLICPGPDGVTMGTLPQTPRAKRVIELAIDTAQEMGLAYVSTEHLLIGLLRETEGVGFQILSNLGVTVEDVKKEIVSILGSPQTHHVVVNVEDTKRQTGFTTFRDRPSPAEVWSETVTSVLMENIDSAHAISIADAVVEAYKSRFVS